MKKEKINNFNFLEYDIKKYHWTERFNQIISNYNEEKKEELCSLYLDFENTVQSVAKILILERNLPIYEKINKVM